MKHQQTQDKSIEYNTQINRVKNLLSKIKNLGLNPTKLEQEVEKIEIETKKEVEQQFKNFGESFTNQFLYDTTNQAYQKGIQKISQIGDYLIEEYNEYYIISNACNELDLKVKEINSNNVMDYVIEIKNLLKQMNQTTPLDYKLEEPLVERVYTLAYQIIKLEILYQNRSTLILAVRENTIHAEYISKYIIKEIDSLDLTDKKYQDISLRLAELRKKGLQNNNLIDGKLISLLMYATDEILSKNEREKFLMECEKIENYNNELTKLKHQNTSEIEKLEHLNAEKKSILKKTFKKNLFLIGNIASLSAASFGLYHAGNFMFAKRTYSTVTENYDSRTDKTTFEETYQELTKLSTIITEYTPWIEPGYFRTEYTRDIYTYDVTNLDLVYDNIEDYLTSDLIDLEIPTKHNLDTASEIPKQELYKENIYLIERITQNREKKNIEPNFEKTTLFTILTTLFLTLIDVLTTITIIKKRYRYLGEDRKLNKEELKEQKEKLLELDKSMKGLLSDYKTLQARILDTYNQLPFVIKENQKIKCRVKKLEDLSNNLTNN